MKSDNKKTILQTNKVHLFLVVILTTLYLLLTLAGCNNIVENPGTGNQNPPESGSNLVAVTGQISLSGAFPGTLQSSTGSQRTAIPTVGVVTYTVTAQNKADPGERVTATVTDYNYTLYLSPGTWTISCSGVNESGSQIIREKSPIELTVTQGVATPQPGILELVLSQTPGTGGTGAVSLNGAIDFVKDGSAATVTLDITLTPWESSVRAPDIPPQTIKGNGNFTVTLDAVPSGAYMMTLVFSVDGVAVSTVEEAVNVFDNMTTDTWYVGGGNSDHLTPQQDGSAVFNLTRCRTEFFIDGTGGDDTNPGSALKPLKTMGKAFSVLGKVKGADAKITLQSDAGDTEDVTVPEGVDTVIFGEQAATVPELISVGDGAAVKVGTNVTCSGGAIVQNGGSLTLTQGGRIDGTGLTGIKNSSGGAVYIEGGTFTMENGSTVTGGNITGNGGAVYVDSGTFTMNGGTITGGQAQYGGGVYIDTDGTFTMNGNAVIEGNKATQNNKGGGGVYVNNGTFTMSGGTIGGDNKNTAMNGGGVYVDANGSFTMDGNAVISNNEVERNGGGVCVFGTFTMKGSAAIRGNNANTTKRWNGGGGVLVCEGGQFEMTEDAVIENNHTDGTGKDDADNNGVNGCGGGVLVRDPGSAFTMSGKARITGNTAVDHGGGVYVDDIFTVSGSPTITGNTVSNNANNVYLPSGKTITIGAEGLTGGTIGVTAADMVPDGATPITDKDVTGAVRILISDDATYSVAEDIAISGGSGTAVFLSDADVSYQESSALARSLGALSDAVSEANKWTSGGTITLMKNIDGNNAVFGTDGVSIPIIFRGGTCTLDLNGKTINRSLQSDRSEGQVIVIRDDGELTIKDSSANADGTGGIGKITGGFNDGDQDNGGGGIYVESGSLTLESGSITGNKTLKDGGGVYVGSGCTFTMKGGSITGNTANTNGGGVYVDGTFIAGNTPSITGNTVSGRANNVYLPSGKTIICDSQGLTGGNIGITVGVPPSSVGNSVDITNFIVKEPASIFKSDTGGLSIGSTLDKIILKKITYTGSLDTITRDTEDTIYIGDATIDKSSDYQTSAIDAVGASGKTVTLDISGTNEFHAGGDRPGIYVPSDGTLKITGGGTLKVYGGVSWPAIGLNGGKPGVGNGTIEIAGGTIYAYAGSNAAAIGGSWGCPVAAENKINVTISGGEVFADGTTGWRAIAPGRAGNDQVSAAGTVTCTIAPTSGYQIRVYAGSSQYNASEISGSPFTVSTDITDKIKDSKFVHIVTEKRP